MTRAYNTLAFMRHHGLGVREGMAFELISIYHIATTRNIAEGMGIERDAATQLVHRLRHKGFVEAAPFTRTSGTDHSVPRAEKVWKLKDEIFREWDMIQSTNRLPKWKRPAAPVSGRKPSTS